MSNSFAAIIATATDAAQVVAQEPTGFIDAIEFQPSVEGATLNSTVNLGIVTPPVERAWAPGMSTTVADSIEKNVPLTLTQAFEEVFHLTGEQIAALSVGNFNASRYTKTKFAQCFRALRNKIDGYIALQAKYGQHRLVGTAGTTPFASNMDVSATIRRFLEENGSPINPQDVSVVIDPAAAENVRKLLGTPTAAGGSLAADMQRTGMLPQHNGMQYRTSPQIALHTKGTGSAYTATCAAGATDVTLAAGSGTIVKGDALAFAGDSNVYGAGAAAAATGLITGLINRPGARSAKAGAALTIGNNYTPNVALHRSALLACVRPPAQVPPDMALGAPKPFLSDVIVDPVNGLPYGLFVQIGDGLVHFSVRAIYDAVPVNTEFIIGLMG